MPKILKKRCYDQFDKTYFEVVVAIHGKTPHTETYSIQQGQLDQAINLGYFDTSASTQTYLDWKPLNNLTNLTGGIKEVNKYSYDEKYAYAHTAERTYSLPRYLFDRVGERDHIFFGRREK